VSQEQETGFTQIRSYQKWSTGGTRYPRIVKWAKIADNEGKFVYLWIPKPNVMDLVFAGHEFFRNVTPANTDVHLKSYYLRQRRTHKFLEGILDTK